MSLRSLLRKEAYWSRRNALTLLLLLVVLPGFFAASSVLFQDVIPRDTPVAVVPQDEEVTQGELLSVEGGLAFFATPVEVESREAALRQLGREGVYAVIEVPHGIRDAGRDVTFRLYVDGSMVPFKEPSLTIASIMQSELNQRLDASIAVERVVVGNSHDLSGYLVPIVLFGLVVLFAFTYVPYTLATERDVIDRIRLESSLEALVGAKLAFFTLLMVLPIAVFHVALGWLGYGISAIAPATVLTLLLTFVTLAALSMAVVVLTRFGTVGRFVNVLGLLLVVGFSGLAYPAGYFSDLRKAAVRAMPTHYAVIVTRSSMLREAPMGAFTDWIAGLALVAAASLVILELSIVYFRRVA
jgi:ABC-2 type transport system permease protein